MASRARHRLLHDTVSIGRYASEDLVVDNYSVSVGRKAGNNGPIGAYAIAIGDKQVKTINQPTVLQLDHKLVNLHKALMPLPLVTKLVKQLRVPMQ